MKAQQLTITIILFLICIKSFSQELRPGFIVTNNNDTLNGYLPYKIDKRLSNNFEFTNDKNSKLTIYAVDGIKSFGFFNNRIFERIPSIEQFDSAAFAKRILTGKLSFYVSAQPKKNKEFIIKNNISGESIRIKKDTKENSPTAAINYLGLISKIKNDSIDQFFGQKKIKLSESAIKNDLIEYNKQYENTFPVISYNEEKIVSYDISLGAALLSEPDANFRFSVLRNAYHPDRNSKLSFISGITYQIWRYSDKRIAEAQGEPWFLNNLKIIPIGINIQRLKGNVRPYIYSGFGLILSYSSYEFEQTITTVGANGSSSTTTKLIAENDLEAGPTLLIGAGLKVKAGSNFIIFEVVPSDSGIFLNLGLSIY